MIQSKIDVIVAWMLFYKIVTVPYESKIDVPGNDKKVRKNLPTAKKSQGKCCGSAYIKIL